MVEDTEGAGAKPCEQSDEMVARDIRNNRVVVSLWTTQFVTVLFVVASIMIWMILVTGIPTADVVLSCMGISCVVMLAATLFFECRLYLRHNLTIEIYVLFQVIKASSWAIVLAVLVEICSGIEDGGIRVLTDAAKKLILPFLASVLFSVVVCFQERARRTLHGPSSVESFFLAAERFENAYPG